MANRDRTSIAKRKDRVARPTYKCRVCGRDKFPEEMHTRETKQTTVEKLELLIRKTGICKLCNGDRGQAPAEFERPQ